MKNLIASDLDGTVRQSPRIFDSLRDNSKYGIIRLIAGQLAALFARRINSDIEASVYITGSPKSERLATLIWLYSHKMSTDLYMSNTSRLFNDKKPNDDKSSLTKIKAINQIGADIYFEDNRIQGKAITKNTKTKVKYVK